jgi:plastocyanin
MHRVTDSLKILIAAAALAAALPCLAAHLNISVKNQKGEPVKDAVVYADVTGQDNVISNGHATIDQIDEEFVPQVKPIMQGTTISFPNQDNIRHHVYSFSLPKTFEIPLYLGTPRSPILFDKPGVVVLGCNIHDWMYSYVFVSNTPFYALTDADGKAAIDNLPAAEIDVRVWHSELRDDPDALSQRVSVSEDGAKEVTFEIRQKRVWRPRRAPTTFGGSY